MGCVDTSATEPRGSRPRPAMSRLAHVAASASLLAFTSALAAGQTTTLPFDGITQQSLINGDGDRVAGVNSGGYTYSGTRSFASPLERNFVLNPALTAQVLELRISLEGLVGEAPNVGPDNFRFHQSSASPIALSTT